MQVTVRVHAPRFMEKDLRQHLKGECDKVFQSTPESVFEAIAQKDEASLNKLKGELSKMLRDVLTYTTWSNNNDIGVSFSINRKRHEVWHTGT